MNTLERFLDWEKKSPNTTFLKQPLNGEITERTFSEAGHEIRKITAGLQSIGLRPGDHIAILSKNCAEWIMADLAIMMGGFISIPIYPTLSDHSIQPILEHSESKAIFIGKLDDYAGQKNGIPSNVAKIGMSKYDINETYSWEDWVENKLPSSYTHEWKDEDIFTIMYTSGTTGKPKGVMHDINAFKKTSEVAIKGLAIDTNKSHRVFSYLPLSHIAERIGIETVGIRVGATFSFAESLDTFAQNLADTQPTLFFAVPRIWSKFREKIEEKLPPSKLNTILKIPIINNIIKKSIQKKLGLAQADHIFSGAAPITVEMLQWYEKLGIRILQAYGMTEDCVYAHFNRNNDNKHGTVGLPLDGLQVKIAENGEIRVKSEGLTKGYYKEPEMTKDLFDEEGYLKTGDIGERDSHGFLTITGRIKDQFKTDKGKYIDPAPIEMKISTNTNVESVCVVGTGVPQPIALITLTENKPLSENIRNSLQETLKETNDGLEPYEMVHKIVVMKTPWTVENGLITPTLKVKRNEVEKIHLNSYPTWYEKQDAIVASDE